MADPGGEVTEQHRRAQVALAAGAARAVLDAWRQVSPTGLEGSAGRWLAEALEVTRGYRGRSRALSAAYVRLLRGLRIGRTLPPLVPGIRRSRLRLGELRDEFAALSRQPRQIRGDDGVSVEVDEGFDWPEVDENADERRATVSLVTSGPVRAERGVQRLRQDTERGRLDDPDFLAELDTVMRDAGASAAGAAELEAQRGGRNMVESSSRADRQVIGWARVTDSDPCAFCAMLASRGAVYRSAWSAQFTGAGRRGRQLPQGWEDWSPTRLAEWEASKGVARFHDNCHCTIIPVYSRTDWLPDQSRAFRELYFESTEGLTGPAARAAFRKAVERRRRLARARGVDVA